MPQALPIRRKEGCDRSLTKQVDVVVNCTPICVNNIASLTNLMI